MNAEALPLQITEVEKDAPVQSCFLPGTNIQFAWDSTSLGYLKACPRLYQYIMIDGWSPREDSIHLIFGQHYHSALEEYDRWRALESTHEEALRAAVELVLERTRGWVINTETKAGRYKNRETLLGLVIDYLDKFKDDVATTYMLEGNRPAVELSFRFELDWGPGVSAGSAQYIKDPNNPAGIIEFAQPYLLCGHLDRVVTFSDELFVMDRKTTTSTIGTYYFEDYAPSNQMTLYTLASRVILEAPIQGVIIDAAQIKLEEPHAYQRGFTMRTGEQLDEWLKDLERWLAMAESYAEAGYWPMNEMSCGNYGGCRFREVCSKSPSVREQFLKSKFVQKEESDRWNPLKPR